MDQPDLPIDNLLAQLEEYRVRREVRDARPDRVTDFITEVAQAFEPLHGVGRVGFDCKPAPEGWAISMYLGATEVVGGREDGLKNYAAFHFDVDTAIALFTNVESIRFNSEPADAGIDSGVLIQGHIDEFPIRLAVHAFPPTEVAPAMRRMPDRTLRLT
ncbi:MAG: hypothetical protein AB8G99_20645 [Planctomycetaceae bacterium]